mgnify:FL=1
MKFVVTQFEDFSNEIFFKIFEYIEIFDLFNIFSNLNNRFTDLLKHPSLRFDATLTSQTNSNSELLRFHQSQIVSLRFKAFFPNSDFFFTNLHKLIFDEIPLQKFIIIFPNLTKLSRLRSLTIHFHDSIIDLTEIYVLIFRLSQLKNLEIISQGHLLTLQLPCNTFEQRTFLDKFIIRYQCNFNDFILLLSHMPNVKYLSCLEITKTIDVLQRNFPIKTNHLTRLVFSMCKISFDQLEIFLGHFGRQLELFHINTSNDETYLVADRWQRIICETMPRLKQFQFQYHEWHYQNFRLTSSHQSIDKFTTQFWTNRQWTFEITADMNYWPPIRTIYSISSVRYNQSTANEKIGLKIDCLHYSPYREDIVDDCFSFLSRFYITTLYVNCKKLIFTKLIKLLSLLPNLDLFGVRYLSSFEPTNQTESCSNTNQITKLTVDNFIDECDLKKITYFIDLCPYLNYFQIKCENICSIQAILRYVLSKLTYLNSLSFYIPIVTDDLIEQLKIMCNCEIRRCTDRICLKILNK